MVSQDQLQLALAMSASLAPPSTLQSEVLPGPRERKRARHGKGRPSERGALPTSVITMSSTEKQKILAQRASAIVREVCGVEPRHPKGSILVRCLSCKIGVLILGCP